MGNTSPSTPPSPGDKPSRGCCSAGAGDVVSVMSVTPPSSSPSGHEIKQLKEGMLSLQRMVGDMQGNLSQLQTDNLALQHQNKSLEVQNQTLMESLAEQDCVETWTHFDIVEEHYKQLARHHGEAVNGAQFVDEDRAESTDRMSARNRHGEADSAAGLSAQPCSPEAGKKVTELTKEEAKIEDVAISFMANSKEDVNSVSGHLVAAVVAKGYRREEIVTVKPNGFSDSTGDVIEASTPAELVSCEHWPVTLNFHVGVRRIAAEAPLDTKSPKGEEALLRNVASGQRRSTGLVKVYRLDDDTSP